MSVLTRRVERGVALLDRERPGWRDEIDVDSLHLGDCTACVLGQLYGDYETGIRELHIDYTTSDLSGFSVPYSEDTSISNRYGWLTRVWRKVISGV